MDRLNHIINEITRIFAAYVPNLFGALVILIVGWLIALIAAAVMRAVLRRTKLDNRLAGWVVGEEGAPKVNIERIFAKAVFYLIMLFVLVAFFQALGLTLITEPLNRFLTRLLEYAPRLLSAGLLILVAWTLASLVRRVVVIAMKTANLDERLSAQDEDDPKKTLPLSQTLADVLYWLILLLFLPAILGALALEGLLEPVRAMVLDVLGYLPNLFAAALILFVGWLIARMVQRIVTNLSAGLGVDRLADSLGLSRALASQPPSQVIGLLVYVLILIPVLVSGLNALALDAITQPASRMLDQILGAVPALLAASLVLIIAYVVARIVASLVSGILVGFGFDHILVRLGLGKEQPPEGATPSEIVGRLILVVILLFAAIEAFRLLGFALVADLVAQLTVFLGQISLGLIIFAIGLFVANLVADIVRASGSRQANLLALLARVAILVLAGAMALRQMGLANEIITLAFGIVLGAVAVALALAFGLGARDVAAREVGEWVRNLKSEE